MSSSWIRPCLHAASWSPAPAQQSSSLDRDRLDEEENELRAVVGCGASSHVQQGGGGYSRSRMDTPRTRGLLQLTQTGFCPSHFLAPSVYCTLLDHRSSQDLTSLRFLQRVSEALLFTEGSRLACTGGTRCAAAGTCSSLSL